MKVLFDEAPHDVAAVVANPGLVVSALPRRGRIAPYNQISNTSFLLGAHTDMLLIGLRASILRSFYEASFEHFARRAPPTGSRVRLQDIAALPEGWRRASTASAELDGYMRRRTPRMGWYAFSPWIDVAMKYAEMTIAASQVVAHRTRRIAVAGGSPNTEDRREFSLMHREKIDAAALAAQAVGAELMRINYRLGTQAWLAMLAASVDTLNLAGSRTLSQAVARQARLARTLYRAVPTPASVSSATASLAREALKPVHGRATRNARRLRRK